MSDQVQLWRELADSVGLRINAPCTISLPEYEPITAVCHLLDFGGPKGIVVDPRDSVLSRSVMSALANAGYGYSVFTLNPEETDYAMEALADWKWSGPPELKPAWLTEVDINPSDWRAVRYILGVLSRGSQLPRTPLFTEFVRSVIAERWNEQVFEKGLARGQQCGLWEVDEKYVRLTELGFDVAEDEAS